MLDKLSGVWAPRPSTGPHKLRVSVPLMVLLRSRLHYALNYREVMTIVKDKAGNIKVDNKLRRDPHFPVGYGDVVTKAKNHESYRLLYDMKGRFILHKIDDKEAKYKLCKVIRHSTGPNSIPYIVTHDGRTIRFSHPEIKAGDTIKVNMHNIRSST